MRTLLKASEWPITIKVPLLVTALMLGISLFVSNTVLSRLAETQERELQTLSRAYLDGLSANLLPFILHEDVWDVFDTLERARAAYPGLNALNTIVLNASNRVIAATDPKAFPTARPVAAEILQGLDRDGTIHINESKRTARLLSPVVVQGQRIGSIYTQLDISALLAERQAVLWQLVLTNAGITFILAAVGYWAVRRLVKPVRTIGAYLDRSSDGLMEIIPDPQLRSAKGEFARLFHRYNAMARAANERLGLANQLAKEERLASLGRLASGMAHEINNPLGGLFNALDSLKRYGDREAVRSASISLLERGLSGIRDVVRATLMTYRRADERGSLSHDDIEDLRYLIRSALRQKGLVLAWKNVIDTDQALSGANVRDVALNLLLNACAASPGGGRVSFSARTIDRAVEIAVEDQGSGLPEPYRSFLENGGPAILPLKQGEGLGLWMVRRLLDETGAVASVTADAHGTKIRLSFPLAGEDVRHVA